MGYREAMTQKEIATALQDRGFELMPVTKGYKDKVRLEWQGVQGSAYAGDDYLSATGDMGSRFERILHRTSSDHKGYPVWRGSAIMELIQTLPRL
ncbi:MAG: hypothetical protein LBR20_08175 [Propionibacteriaceae bacterium]|nr:hypothetical protein [Propionibacteriaceae bacterium]